MTKAPTPTEKSKKQRENTKTPPKTPMTQRLRTDLGRSVGVTIATQTGVVKPVYGIPTLKCPLNTDTVPFCLHSLVWILWHNRFRTQYRRMWRLTSLSPEKKGKRSDAVVDKHDRFFFQIIDRQCIGNVTRRHYTILRLQIDYGRSVRATTVNQQVWLT